MVDQAMGPLGDLLGSTLAAPTIQVMDIITLQRVPQAPDILHRDLLLQAPHMEPPRVLPEEAQLPP